MGKKHIAFALGDDSSQYFVMEVDEQEFRAKVWEMKHGDSKEGATVTDFNMYKAVPASSEPVLSDEYRYSVCNDGEVLDLFGTISGDSIVEFFFEHSDMKCQA